ncbi:MAG: CoB--CoM heterodisulfide reductase iron-sulfur subunit B family protein [Candidatus Methanoperedens sp.]|nr:CoB--CoM heterodisulfide reductase iron-sulfur subunit B family protein [Candidatus Methanoperedens sp.]
MTLGFYPGCSLKGSSREYAESVLAVAKEFDINLEEIKDWNCCGATAAHNMNKELSLALPARILSLAEKQGLTEIVVPCAACYSRLTVTKHELSKDPALKAAVTDANGLEYTGSVSVLNIVQMLDKYVTPNLESRVVKPFDHKVACYYGCLLVRPHEILKFDREEDPQSLDVLMLKAGAIPIDWAFKTECCGAGLSVSRTSSVGRLSGKIIGDAKDRGAEVVIVACPMCHSNLDMRRDAINSFLGEKIDIPVLYITQAIGLALGLDRKSLGLQRHFVKVLV